MGAMKLISFYRAAAAFVCFAAAGAAQGPGPLPLREITVFKDGNSFVRAEAELPVSAENVVVHAAVPKALLGTFWPYVPAGGPRLVAATSGRSAVRVTKTALDLRELILANIGADVLLGMPPETRVSATIAGVLSRTAEERRRTSPEDAAPALLPETSTLVLLKTSDGTRPYPIERVSDLTFRSPPKTEFEVDEVRESISWRLDPAAPPSKSARVGYACLVKGFRWTPSYRIELDGQGGALVTLSATLANDGADLYEATVNFVVGAPRLDFAGEMDPIALEASVRAAFEGSVGLNFNNPSQSFSNSMQVAMPGSYEPVRASGEGGIGLNSARADDLYVFTAEKITLPRGGRLAVKVAEWKLRAAEFHRLSLPATPPAGLQSGVDASARDEMARLAALPKVVRYLRFLNDGVHPLTTAPASIFKEGRLLGQGLITYTATGGVSETALSVAVDVRVKRDDRIIETTVPAESRSATRGGTTFVRSDSGGEITVTNLSQKPIELEVTREVYGAFDAADEGTFHRLDWFDAEDAMRVNSPSRSATWWQGYHWGHYWRDLNGVGRARWNRSIPPGASAVFSAKWHVFLP